MTHTWFTPSWIVRTSSSQEAFVPSLMKSIQDIDRTLPIAGIYTIQDLQKKTLAPQEFNAELMGMMAGLAFLLALVGVYGLISNSVAKRKREMGIRLALGASTLQAVGQVASEGIVLALLGAALGLVLARLTSEFLRGLVFGLSTTDVVTFLAVAVGLVLVASLASIIPSLRVAAIDPATTLKAD
jgi:ABC-type antimicrobial peptide transport system permease subunit